MHNFQGGYFVPSIRKFAAHVGLQDDVWLRIIRMWWLWYGMMWHVCFDEDFNVISCGNPTTRMNVLVREDLPSVEASHMSFLYCSVSILPLCPVSYSMVFNCDDWRKHFPILYDEFIHAPILNNWYLVWINISYEAEVPDGIASKFFFEEWVLWLSTSQNCRWVYYSQSTLAQPNSAFLSPFSDLLVSFPEGMLEQVGSKENLIWL